MNFRIPVSNCIDFLQVGRWEKLERSFFEGNYCPVSKSLVQIDSWFKDLRRLLVLKNLSDSENIDATLDSIREGIYEYIRIVNRKARLQDRLQQDIERPVNRGK